MDTPHARLRHARTEAGFGSARAAALRFGWSPSTYGAHENGQNGFDTDTALIYARAFASDVAWLLLGDLPIRQQATCEWIGVARSPDNINLVNREKVKESKRTVNIVFTVPEQCKAISIYGDGFWPRYDPRTLLLVVDTSKNPSFPLGGSEEEHFVILRNGKRHIRKLYRPLDTGPFELRAHNSPPIYGIEEQDFEQVWQIWMSVPLPNWGFLDIQYDEAYDRPEVADE